ncbi:hypothetical protein C8Q70DRAFT_549665 [Cubamyces menziesii]|nr:hypothetical protein C8Q70DRAFT_549665 [Cubamyces menziesii]
MLHETASPPSTHARQHFAVLSPLSHRVAHVRHNVLEHRTVPDYPSSEQPARNPQCASIGRSGISESRLTG